MHYFITEIQTRHNGSVNSTVTTHSTLTNGLHCFYDRASKAVIDEGFLSVALTLQDERGKIIKNECLLHDG